MAALFLIIVVAGAIAAMARLTMTTNSSVSLGLQQARAYQTARAGMEWGIARALKGQSCGGLSALNGFSVSVGCTLSSTVAVPEENKSVQFYRIDVVAQYGAVGDPDYAYRSLTSVGEKP
ncbi:hypothetical protein GCM10009304_32860 [Pseudomonas matsuisoli]|uniref:MSHA biogenesis protein MshP n=1 Tax=Pseudomonas matsuisoli TaxID=1515666 RepID=A0A917V0B6_9PSED|nr:hypothetical protein GCM10009304_32860 [Pseudomonas matsuisoli]